MQIGVRHGGYTYKAEIGLVFTNTTPNPVSTSIWCPPFQTLEKKVHDHWVAATGYKNCCYAPTATSAAAPRMTAAGKPYAPVQPSWIAPKETSRAADILW